MEQSQQEGREGGKMGGRKDGRKEGGGRDEEEWEEGRMGGRRKEGWEEGGRKERFCSCQDNLEHQNSSQPPNDQLLCFKIIIRITRK